MSVGIKPAMTFRAEAAHVKEQDYRPGLEEVFAGETAISSVVGGLQYRGYAIEDLAEHTTFEEVAYLLLHGELPTAGELLHFTTRLGMYRGVPDSVLELTRLIPPRVPATDALRSAVSLLGHFDSELRRNDQEANLHKAERLLAALPVLIAARFRSTHGLEPVRPSLDLGHAECFLNMLSGGPIIPAHAKAFEVSLILAAEHEIDASTFACRLAASTQSDLYSAVICGIGTLKGPLHGGANEVAIKMLLSIGSPTRAWDWTSKALTENRLSTSFGSRTDTAPDPRTEIMKSYCGSIARLREDVQLEQTADIVERVAKAQRGLSPNFTWPVGRLYYYMGLELELYTPISVAARVAGWSAHIIEQLRHNHIFRPVGRYVGPASRGVIPLEERPPRRNSERQDQLEGRT